MRSTIKKLVTPPTFADETQSRLVSWLHTYLILAIITVLILLPAILDSSERLSTSLMISTAWLVTHFLSWVLLRHRLVQLSKYLIISSFFIISVVTLFLYNGLRSFSIVSFFIFLAVISFLTNARTLIFFAALSIAVFSVAFYAEQIGIIQPVFIPMIAPITLTLLLGALTAHTLILRFIVHAHQAQEENNRHITNELIVRNHALEASQSLLQKAHDELEKRVADRTFQLSWTNEQLSHEIKDRQLAVDMLLKSEATWRSLVTHAPNTILTIDTAFKILFTNQVTELMQKKHPVGNSVFDIQLQSDCFPLMRQCFQDVIETGELGAFEATGVGALNGR
ncbi:MAG: hypothetical protein GY943_10405, partial [Chloroflexi bacterium]|nr:hypothetical protein [Chloroflexota bacterium]